MHLGRSPLAQVDLVEIRLQNLLLGVTGLNHQGHHRFPQLAPQGSFRGEKEILDQLLGQSAGPLLHVPGLDIRQESPHHPPQINPVVVLETLVLHGIDCAHQMRGNRFDLDQLALLTIFPEKSADRLGLENHHLHTRPGTRLLDFFDQPPGQAKGQLPSGFWAKGMIERAQVNPQPTRVPLVASGLQGPAVGLLPVTQAQQPAREIHALPVRPGIDNQRGGIDSGGHAEAPALKAKLYDPIDLQNPARESQTQSKADRGPHAPEPAQQPLAPGAGGGLAPGRSGPLSGRRLPPGQCSPLAASYSKRFDAVATQFVRRSRHPGPLGLNLAVYGVRRVGACRFPAERRSYRERGIEP